MRQRITGIIGLGLLTGIVFYLAALVAPGEGEVLLVHDEGWRLADGPTLELPGRPVETYPLRRGLELPVDFEDVDGRSGTLTLNFVRTIDPARLAADHGRFGTHLEHLPELILTLLVRRVCQRLSLEETYGPLRAEVSRLLSKAVNRVLVTGCDLRIEDLRLRDVLSVEPPPLQLLVLRLDGLAWPQVENSLRENRPPTIKGLLDHGCLLHTENPDLALTFAGYRGLVALCHGDRPNAKTTKPPPPVEPIRSNLINTSADVRGAAAELTGDLDEAGRLLAEGAETVVVRSNLFAEFSRRWWPALQRYRELRYRETFPFQVHLDDELLVNAMAYGELFERLLRSIDDWLGELLDGRPDLTVAVGGCGGYGLDRDAATGEAAWGPVENAWLLLCGLHVRPGLTFDTTSAEAAGLLEVLCLARSPEGSLSADVLEPSFLERRRRRYP